MCKDGADEASAIERIRWKEVNGRDEDIDPHECARQIRGREKRMRLQGSFRRDADKNCRTDECEEDVDERPGKGEADLVGSVNRLSLRFLLYGDPSDRQQEHRTRTTIL